MSNRSFQNSEFYDRDLKVREFKVEDIDKTLHLVHTPSGEPNLLLALGLCCYTEYWGKLLLGVGKEKKASRAPFNEFLYRLDRTINKTLQSFWLKNN